MKTKRPDLTVLACSVILVWAATGQAQAAQKKAKESAPAPVSARPHKPLPETAQKTAGPWTGKAAIPLVSERQPERAQKEAGRVPSETKMTDRTGRRHVKVRKRVAPKALVRPRTDLMHHGLLEDRRRYDPRLDTRTDGVPSPQTSELVHDHFQELDRNRDGKIDPVERAVGRLDIDRDLHSRQPR